MSRKARFNRDLQRLGVDSDHDILTRFDLSSAYYDGRPRGIYWLINSSLIAVCTLIFAHLEGRLCFVDPNIKDQAFSLIGLYALWSGLHFVGRSIRYWKTLGKHFRL